MKGREIEKYLMMMNIVSSIGLPFEEVIKLEDFEIYSLDREIRDSRIPNHLGLIR